MSLLTYPPLDPISSFLYLNAAMEDGGEHVVPMALHDIADTIGGMTRFQLSITGNYYVSNPLLYILELSISQHRLFELL